MRELAADCSRCAALCCVALPFTRSADFAFDKAAGTPCQHLQQNRCGIHGDLRARGFGGCVAYDCFGAGQHVVQHTFGGRDHHDRTTFAVFIVVQQLHEVLWYLDEVREESADADGWFARIAELADGTPDEVLSISVDDIRTAVGDVLAQVSARRRGPDAPKLRRADLAGADLRERRMLDADLRGAVLIGADLRGVDLGQADLLGADLRGARLDGAALRDALFLTRAQLAAAVVDDATTIPGRLR